MPDANRVGPVGRRQREDWQRRVARAYDAEPAETRTVDAFAPRGLLEAALAFDAQPDPPTAEETPVAEVRPRKVLVVTTAADLRALHKAIMSVSTASPGPIGRSLSMVA